MNSILSLLLVASIGSLASAETQVYMFSTVLQKASTKGILHLQINGGQDIVISGMDDGADERLTHKKGDYNHMVFLEDLKLDQIKKVDFFWTSKKAKRDTIKLGIVKIRNEGEGKTVNYCGPDDSIPIPKDTKVQLASCIY